MGKTWNSNGKEDKFIQKLIKDGKINRFSKPLKLRTDYPDMFGDFTPNVVRNHLNMLKRSHGLYLDGDSDDETINNDNDDTKRERQPFDGSSMATATAIDEKEVANSTISGFNSIVHLNYPVICEMYKDPETECDKVAMVLTMPAGAQDVTIEISDGGMTATIKYKWIQSMYNMRDLFSKMLTSKQIYILHPRILCIKNGLEKYRKRIDAAPEAIIKITLPITVQTSADSWSYTAVKKNDGTLILMADLTGYVKGYNTKIGNVRFD